MGRHVDSQTLEFIKKLKEKGESLGYATAEEFPLINGLYFADLVWRLAENQPPLVTFEVETEDSLRAFKNMDKYFGTLSSEVPKPYRHFLLVIRGKLSEGTRKSLQRDIDYYNVSLFEDLANSLETQKVLFAELDRLKVQLRDIVSRFLSSGKIDETFEGIRSGIQKGLPAPFKSSNVSVTFGADANEDPFRPFSFTISGKSDPGEPTVLQKIHDAQKTGEKLLLTKEDGIEIIFPGMENAEFVSLEMKSETLPGTLFELHTRNSDKSLELVLNPVTETDEYEILSNEKQDVPYTFEFKIDKKAKQMRLSIRFDSQKSDVYQYVYFTDFMKRVKQEKLLTLRNVSDGKEMQLSNFSGELQAPTEDWMKILTILSEIQRKTKVRLPVPTQISSQELTLIEALHKIVNKGELEGLHKWIDISLTKEEAVRRLYFAKNPDVIENLQATARNQSVPLLGQNIPLGDVTIIIPEARIDIGKLEDQVKQAVEPVRLRADVIADHPARILYSKWAKRESSPL